MNIQAIALMRAEGIALCLLLFAVGCQQSPKVETVSEKPANANQVVFKSKAPADKLVSKNSPVLGTDAYQLKFKVEDAQAILANKPRPTYDATLAVLAGNPPSDIDVCNLPFSALTQAIFQECIQEGMSYIQAANTIGYAGTLTASSQDSETWQWSGGDGKYLTSVFVGGKLASKSQVGLK